MEEYRIQVLPSGHEFDAVEQETLLEAALRSGLNVNFNCYSGSCGGCKARLVKGVLGKHDRQDFRLSPLEKSLGTFLLCTAHAEGDLVIETGEARSPSDIPRQQLVTKLSKFQEVGEHLRILQLRTPRTSPLRFLAGQHVALSLPGVGTIDSSIASCPCNGSQLQFHIPYESGNPFVEKVFNGLRHGSEIGVDGPFGEMTLDDDSTRPLLMIGQAHELAPVKSLIEHAINLDVTQAVRLFWITQKGEHYLDNHCRSWAAALDDYHYVPLEHTSEQASEAQAEQVMNAIATDIEHLAQWDIYWAGDKLFNDSLKERLVAAGAEPSRLFYPRRRTSPHNTRRENA